MAIPMCSGRIDSTHKAVPTNARKKASKIAAMVAAQHAQVQAARAAKMAPKPTPPPKPEASAARLVVAFGPAIIRCLLAWVSR